MSLGREVTQVNVRMKKILSLSTVLILQQSALGLDEYTAYIVRISVRNVTDYVMAVTREAI